jgi:transposase
MNYAHITQGYVCGVDLHARSLYLKILDHEGQVVYKRNMPNNFALFKEILKPYLPDIAVGVESTFNYYWLYDGCRDAGIPFHLGHAAYMKAIAGNKHKNDPLDAETIAHLLRSNLFPEAYPYPREMRAVRDLLRRRQRLVRLRSEAYGHVQLLLRQQGILDFAGKDVKRTSAWSAIVQSVKDADVSYLLTSDLLLIEQLDNLIEANEKQIRSRAQEHNGTDFALLKTVPGVGDMLALSILYETHDIHRFPGVQHYASYCRVIRVQRRSNHHVSYGRNQKMGNPYLKCAYGQILSHARQCSTLINACYQKLEARRCAKLARGIMSHKFAVAVYHMLRKREAFNEERFLKVASCRSGSRLDGQCSSTAAKIQSH